MRVRKRTILAAVLVLLVMVSGVTVAKARGSPELSAFAPDNEFVPGEDAELQLYLQNAGEVAYADTAAEQARVTTARDVVVELEADDAPIEIKAADGTQPVGNVPEGVSSPIGFEISVDEGAKPGEYELPLSVEYTYTQVIGRSGAYNGADGELNTHVTIIIENDARFRVVSTSADSLFGEAGSVSVTIRNEGTATANDATFTLESSSGQLTFDGDSTARTFVGEWAPDETRTVSVAADIADGADRRRYPASASVSYETDDGEERVSESLSIGLEPPLEPRFELDGIESSLKVGEEGVVSGTLQNNGDTVARNAVLVLSADTRNFEPIETEYALGDLEPGSSTEFSFDAEVSEAAAGGPRQLSFTVRYRDRTNAVIESDTLDARVEVGPSSDTFAVNPISASLQPGGSGEIRLEVTNQGDEPVTEVSAKLFANAPLSTGDDEAFIDRLEPGESEEIVFGISASGSALTKAYPVSIDFQYNDEDGDTLLSDTYQVPVSIVEPSDSGGGLPIVPIVVVAIIALGAIAFLVYRRL